MKITDRYQPPLDRVEPTAKTTAAKAIEKTTAVGAATAADGAGSAARVNVSTRAQELSKAGAARIDELRSAIANGTFQVEARAIAAKLVGDD